MANSYFQFKQFTIQHDRCAMKVTTDSCLFGAWVSARLLESSESISSLLDIGTGSGLLAMMVAQKNRSTIDAVEIDAAAAGQARENIAASPFAQRIHVVHADLLQWKTEMKYAAIFANPPFYEREISSANTERNLAHHNTGLSLVPLLGFIKKHLAEDGRFFLLLPAKRGSEITQLFKENGLFVSTLLAVQHTTQHSPFRLMIEGKLKFVESPVLQTMAIKDSDDLYTAEFKQLLKDYYLYL